MPDVCGLVTTTVLYTKITDADNKIPDTSSLVNTTAFNRKIEDVDDDGSQNMFVYQSTIDTLKLKKDKGTDFDFVYTSTLLNVSHYVLLSYIE